MSPKIKITKAYLASYIQTCAFGQASTEAVQQDLAPFMTDTFTQYRGGVEQDYRETLLHLAKLRDAISEFKFEMFDLVVDETARTFASRFHSWVRMKEGKEVAVEIALFGNFNKEGKFIRMHEVSTDLK